MNMMNRKSAVRDYGFIIIIIVLGLFNAFGTIISALSLFAAVIEYGIVLTLLSKGKYRESFIYYIAFVAITLENDIFIYGERSMANSNRFTFLNIPILGAYVFQLLAFIYLYMGYQDAQLNKYKIPSSIRQFQKWVIILFVTGSVSVIIGMFLNDNGIMNWDYYPQEAIIRIIGYLVKVSIILGAAYIVCDEKWFKMYERHLMYIIAAIAIISTITFILGYHGYYGDSEIMLSTLAIAYTPLLILFANKKINFPNKTLALTSGVLIIAVSLSMPNCIGSKWYMIILAAVAGWFIIFAKLKSYINIIGMTVVGLFLLTLLSEPLISLISGGNEFVEWKLTQAVKTMNIFGRDSAKDWYEDMDNSPLYRIDELHNTFIEYTEKPGYVIFGKGLGGTTRHHTNLLYWESGHGTFSESQIRMGAYHSMHETMAVLFLQHGIAGICFFFIMIGMLAKRLYKTPWAMIGLIWILFYWSYGVSLLIGGVAMVLAIRDNDEHPLKLNNKKNKLFNIR